MRNEQLPEGWEWIELGSIKTFSMYGPRFSSNDYSLEGCLVLRTTDIDDRGKVDTSKAPKLILSEKEIKKYQCQKNDFLITRTGSIGTVAVFNDNVIAIPGAFLIQYRVNDRINTQYLFLYLRSSFAQKYLLQKSAGIGRPNLNVPSIDSLPIPLPPLPIQHQIVSIIEELFSELDAGVQELKTALARLITYRQAVLHHYLNNPDWERVSTSELFDYVTSGSRGWAQYYSDSGAVFLRITNLDFDTLNLDLDESKIQYVNLEGAKEGLRTRVKPGDFLISITGYLGMFAIVPDDIPEAYVNQHIALCRPKDGFNKQFVGHYFTSKTGGIKQLNDMQKGATKAGLSLTDIKSVKIPLPDLQTQTRIVAEIEERLSEADAMENTIRQELKRAENLRQSILKQAFAGELVRGEFPIAEIADTHEQTSIPVNIETGQLNLF